MSMASAIEFYKKKNYDGFDNSSETVEFTIFMNNMFDSLNRKFPAEGVKNNSQDLEVFYVVCCVVVYVFYYVVVSYFYFR